MADIKFPEALDSQIMWTCSSVYLGHRSQSLGGRLLLLRPLLCSFQDVLQTTKNNFPSLRRTNSINRMHFFHFQRKQGRRRVTKVCLLAGQEAETSRGGGDYTGMRTYHTYTHTATHDSRQQGHACKTHRGVLFQNYFKAAQVECIVTLRSLF